MRRGSLYLRARYMTWKPLQIRSKASTRPYKLTSSKCDVSKPASVEALVLYVRTHCGRLDLLILNAGYAGPVTVKMDQGKPEWVHKALEVNAMGTYLAAHYFVPLLPSSPNGVRGFIAIGSVAGVCTTGAYCKYGIHCQQNGADSFSGVFERAVWGARLG